MPRSFLVKKTDKQKDRHEKHSQKESSNPVPRETPPVQDSREVKDDHVTEVQDFQEALRPAVIVETRQRIEDEYKRVEITDDQQSLHSPSTDEGYSESPLHRHSPAHGVNRQGSVSPTYSPHMTPPPRDVYTEARSPTPPSRIQYVGSEIEVCSEPDRHQDRHEDRHHDSHQDRHQDRQEDRESDRESGLSSPHDVYSLSHHYQHEFQHAENRDSMRHVSNSHRHEQYRNASMSPHRMDYHHQESNPRHMDTFYERYSRHDSFQGDYGRSEASHRHREEHFGRADSPARSRSPLDLTVRSNVEPVASAVAPYTPAIPNLSARLSNGYLRDALATSFYRALTTDMVPSDGSGHHGYPSSYTSSPSSSSSGGGRLTPQGLPGYVTSPSRASISSMSPTSPQKAQMSPLCTSVAPSPTPSPALSIQSDSDESIYSASGRKIDRKSAGTTFQDGVTVGYTYDAFFVSDGRSRRKNSMGIPEKSRPRYTCNECGKHYATSSNLSRHKQTHRSVDSKLAKKCPHCTKVYVSMPALSMHILTHELKHKCMVCNKSFSRPWLLQGHMRSHTGDKPYGCAHCGKAFADRSNLRAHMQTHSSFKHYECKRCNKSFALKSYLNKHYESACFKDS